MHTGVSGRARARADIGAKTRAHAPAASDRGALCTHVRICVHHRIALAHAREERTFRVSKKTRSPPTTIPREIALLSRAARFRFLSGYGCVHAIAVYNAAFCLSYSAVAGSLFSSIRRQLRLLAVNFSGECRWRVLRLAKSLKNAKRRLVWSFYERGEASFGEFRNRVFRSISSSFVESIHSD